MKPLRTLLLSTALLLTVGVGLSSATAGQPGWLVNGGGQGVLPSPAALAMPAPDPTDLKLARAHAEGMARWFERGVTAADFSTGSMLFDGEWAFGSWQMAALGYGYMAGADEELRAVHLRRMQTSLDHMLSPPLRRFDAAKWGEDPMESLQGGRGHMAWLGYSGLALAMHAWLEGPDSRYWEQTVAITDAIRHRIAAEPSGVPETYPAERYPVDATAGVAALVLFGLAKGQDDPVAVAWLRDTLPKLRDPKTGLLYQAVDADGKPLDAPRGSGTLLAAWFLGVADAKAGDRLYESAEKALGTTILTLGTMREYPEEDDARGDIDSGPVILGQGVSATGFAIGCALQRLDGERGRQLFKTAEVFGGPVESDGARNYANGGAIGDAILFAMLASGQRARK